ncbi:MAG: response regulator [Acidobacteria bacterium]|nr:response regulator [Acidobacteriota bacterium]NIM62965.1 response regulator [Acidobacteriota bacterium]NIO57890.1 response regulator [Acidobacteriota bacterium]NIQ86109.1 response regulator [Acidobacteriota bacterium]NIT11614.1 response regulator [Acidobacteriota bacterium]
MPRVLIIEDDSAMAVALQDGFSYEGYEVDVAPDGSKGLRLANEGNPDVIVLDVMLPKLSGIDVCKRIRQNNNHVPIIMLTARGQEADKVAGLKIGADDYVTKPFSFLELMARVEAVLRRVQERSESAETYEFGDIRIDFRRTQAFKQGKHLSLSPREFKLLRFMIDHRGEVLARERLLDAVWDYDNVPFTRTVDMHIAKLRKKIEDTPQDPSYIVTVHRVGYRFNG